MKKIFYCIIFTFLIICGCGKGINPVSSNENQEPGFSGTITFVGDWPEEVTRTHLVVFENSLESPADFSPLNLRYVSLEIPFGVKSSSYNSQDSAFLNIGPGKYEYVAVAQQKTVNLSLSRKDWFVVGVYYVNGDTSMPGEIIIPETGLLENIDIICDFNNPPPQPPGGN